MQVEPQYTFHLVVVKDYALHLFAALAQHLDNLAEGIVRNTHGNARDKALVCRDAVKGFGGKQRHLPIHGADRQRHQLRIAGQQLVRLLVYPRTRLLEEPRLHLEIDGILYLLRRDLVEALLRDFLA